MNCDQTQNCMLYLWGEMTAEESAGFVEHLSECPVCKAEVEQLRPVIRSMQAVAPEQVPQDVTERIRTRLSRSIQEQPRKLWITPRRALAAAAAILLILGLGVMWRLILGPAEQLPAINGGQVADSLTEEDYVEALALVWVSESEPEEDSLIDAEIEDIAADIKYLFEQVDGNSVPIDSDGQPNGAQGWQRSSAMNV